MKDLYCFSSDPSRVYVRVSGDTETFRVTKTTGRYIRAGVDAGPATQSRQDHLRVALRSLKAALRP